MANINFVNLPDGKSAIEVEKYKSENNLEYAYYDELNHLLIDKKSYKLNSFGRIENLEITNSFTKLTGYNTEIQIDVNTILEYIYSRKYINKGTIYGVLNNLERKIKNIIIKQGR